MKHKGKKRSKIILLLVILLILLAGAGIAYANKSALINSYYRVMRSPKEYYIYLEKYGLYELVNSLPRDGISGRDHYAHDISSNITFHQNELNSVLDTAVGSNLKDLENLLGIPLNNIGLDVILASDHYMLNEIMSLKLNDTKLLTTELFLDSAAQRMSLRFPELSDSYLTKSLGKGEETMNLHELQQKLLHTDLSKRILRRYTELYFSHLGTVTLEQKVTLSLNKIDTKCSLITVMFTQEQVREFYHSLLETAKSDEDILSLLPLLHTTREQYLQSLYRLESIISERYYGEDQEAVQRLELYVDHTGKVLSRELITFGKTTLGYTLLSKEDYLEYDFHLSQASTNSELRISGTNRRLEHNNQGEIALYLRHPAHFSDPDINIDITYEGMRNVNYEGQHYLEGAFTLSSKRLAGIQITSAFSRSDSLQLNTTAIRLGASPLVEINSTVKPLANYEILQPSATGPRYDLSEYNQYLSGIDLEAYLASLTNSLGINPEALVDLLP